jgi:succinate dehydrogenase / fumarate reductase flavoprotein subunit
VQGRIDRMMGVNGKQSVESFHKRLGRIMWEYCGMARNADGLGTALAEIPKLREEFWSDVRVTGAPGGLNSELEKAGRVADFLEFGELMCHDALQREESCGGHFREEHQTEEGEALRDDANFAHAAVWEFKGDGEQPELSKEPLSFDDVPLTTRSYK